MATVIRRGLVLLLLPLLSGCTESTAPVSASRCGAEPVSLEPGDIVRAGRFESVCRLAPVAGGARYALAVVDGSAIQSARAGHEASFGDYSVSVTANIPGATFEEGDPARAVPALHAVPAASDMAAVSLIDSPADRASPWTLNEQFELRHPVNGQLQPARVVRIYGGRYVVAWFEQGDPARLAATLPMLDSAFPVIQQFALPLLRSAFADTEPSSATAAGQYLILLADTLGPGITGRAFHVERSSTPLGWIALKLGSIPSTASLVSLMTHEMAHTWQFLYLHAARAADASAQFGTLWSAEGGANTVSYFVLGRYAGIAPDANLDWRAPQPTAAAAHYAARAQPQLGEFTAGYENASGFLRRLVLLRMEAGETLEEALREVARGAIEGWFGSGGAGQGLAARMQDVDARWDPANALLDWTMSHAADDRTPNPVLQDRASLRAWDIPQGTLGWFSSGFLSPTVGSLTRTRRYGSPLFVYLDDQGLGLEITVQAGRFIPGMPPVGPTETIPFAWSIVRIQ